MSQDQSQQPSPTREGRGPGLPAEGREQTIATALPVLAAGLAVANLIALRDVFVILRGDEMLTLVAVAAALLAFGVGALFPAGLLGAGKGRDAGFLFFYWLTAIAAPLGLIALRLIHSDLTNDTSCATPTNAFVLAGLAAAPMNFTAGCVMAFALAAAQPPSAAPDAHRNKHALFVLGLAAGSGLFTYLLADNRFPPLLVDLCVSILLLTTAAIIAWRFASAGLVMSPPIWIALLVAATISCSPLGQMLNFFTEKRLFGRDVVETQSGPAGVVSVWKHKEEAVIALNRVPMVRSGPGRRSAQIMEMAHIPLLAHPEPRKVLLLGGSDPDVVEEILNEPVERLRHLMADECTQMAFRSNIGYKAQQSEKLVDQREEMDARSACKALGETYDVILMDLPPPANIYLNRFYTQQFLADAKALLNPDGIMAVRLSRLERAGHPQQIIAFSSFLRTFKTVFKDYVLAGTATTLCLGGGADRGDPTAPPQSADLLEQRKAERGLSFALYDKSKSDRPLLRRGPGREDPMLAIAPANRDLRPVTAFLDLAGWLSVTPPALRKRAMVLLRLDLESLVIVLGVVGFLVLVAGILAPRGGAFGDCAGLCAGQFVAGALAAALLLGDQCVYGTLFRDLGILGTAFFIGGTSGAVITLSRRGAAARRRFFMAGALLILGVVAAASPTVLNLVCKVSDPSLRLLHLFITLPLLCAFIGCAAGALIPAATAPAPRMALAIAALALALGMLAAATIFLPVLGISESSYFAALISSLAILLLLLSRD